MVYVSTCCLKGETSTFVKDVMDAVDKYVKAGIKGIELGSAHQRFDDFPHLKKMKKEHGLKYIFHANFPSMGLPVMVNIATCDEETRKKIIAQYYETIEKLNYLEDEILSIHSGDSADMVIATKELINKSDKESATRRAIESLQLITDRAKQYGVKVAIENSCNTDLPGIMCTPEEFMSIKKEVDVGLLLDTGHLDTYLYHNKRDRKKMISLFEPHIIEMHCHKGIKADEHLLPTKEVFNGFSKETLRKAALTLEMNRGSMKDILAGVKVLEEVSR